MAKPQTIQIFLPDGNARGIRIAEITTRIVQVIEVPRSLMVDFIQMEASNQVAVYFLFGASEEGAGKVYIGQSGDLRSRLLKHNKEKDFWERALVLISRTDSLTLTHSLFLEWFALQQATSAQRYAVENGNSGSRPYTPSPLEADCVEIFETGQILLATLGYPVFDAVGSTGGQTKQEEVFSCKAPGTDGKGLFTPEGFVVLKGSIGRKETVPSLAGTNAELLRGELLDTGVMVVDGESLIFQKDHLFNSPSTAAKVLTGRSINGWIAWKNDDGKTLDELKRPPFGI